MRFLSKLVVIFFLFSTTFVMAQLKVAILNVQQAFR